MQRNRGRRYYKAVDTNNRAWRMAKELMGSGLVLCTDEQKAWFDF
ncbi:hypothetical protein [Pseudoalteromonas sp. C2R02]